MKKYKLTRIILIVAFAFVLALSCLGLGSQFALAETTTALSSLTNIFYKVGSAQVSGGTVGDSTAKYPVISLSTSTQAVSYRKNLAYRWYEKANDTEGDESGKSGMFSLNFALVAENNVLPTSYVITFQSQQYEKTKDGITTNYLVLVPDSTETATTGVYAYVTQDSDDFDKTIDEIKEENILVSELLDYSDMTVAFTSYEKGAYNLNILADDGVSSLQLTNVGGTYAKYVTGTNAVTPLSFKANIKDSSTTTAKIAVKAMNGQSFELDDSDNVTDNTAPVICLDEDVRFAEFGESISFSYTTIDVISSSTDVELAYYVYSKVSDENVFTTLSSSSVAVLLTHENTYRVTSADSSKGGAAITGVEGMEVEGTTYYSQYEMNGCPIDALVKIKYTVSDGTDADTKNTTEVYLDWYVSDEWLVVPKGQTTAYMIASSDSEGVTFDTLSTAGTAKGDDAVYFDTNARDAYQAEIDKLVEEEGLAAGSSNYLYLPSIENLVKDITSAYTDLKISIYYINGSGSKSSNTSLTPSNLSINVTTAGNYEFTFYVTDAEGNPMYYYNTEGVREEFTSSDIWTFHDDSEQMHYLPWFTFRVSNTQPTIEDPGVRTLGYVNSTYNSISFDINGVSSSYTTAYSLYYFNRNQYVKDTQNFITYEEFVDQVEALYTGSETRKYFRKITPSSELDSTYDEYEDDIDYAWDNSSLSFVPQDDNAYYVVKLDLTYNNAVKSSYMAIAVSAEAESFYGETNWAANNVASIVLLCVAGLAFIAIIVLLVVKPKESGDIDVIDANAQSAEKAKAGKNKKEKKSKKKTTDLDNE
jgi:hypothetical protein